MLSQAVAAPAGGPTQESSSSYMNEGGNVSEKADASQKADSETAAATTSNYDAHADGFSQGCDPTAQPLAHDVGTDSHASSMFSSNGASMQASGPSMQQQGQMMQTSEPSMQQGQPMQNGQPMSMFSSQCEPMQSSAPSGQAMQNGQPMQQQMGEASEQHVLSGEMSSALGAGQNPNPPVVKSQGELAGAYSAEQQVFQDLGAGAAFAQGTFDPEAFQAALVASGNAGGQFAPLVGDPNAAAAAAVTPLPPGSAQQPLGAPGAPAAGYARLPPPLTLSGVDISDPSGGGISSALIDQAAGFAAAASSASSSGANVNQPPNLSPTALMAQQTTSTSADNFQAEHQRLRSQKAFADPEWGLHFIDYDRLKSHLDQMGTPADRAPKDFQKSCELFWCILKADIDTVNSFYTKKEGMYLQQFQEFKFDTFTQTEKMDDRGVLCLFAKMLHKLNEEQYFIVARSQELPEACLNLEDDKIDTELSENFEKFFTLCNELDTLRKYVVLNYLTIHRVLSQFDKISEKNSLTAYIPELISEPFYSSMTLAQLLVRTECVTASLMAQFSQSTPHRKNYECSVCRELLVDPVVLSCAHRFCQNCLGVIHDERTTTNYIDATKNWSRCPICRKQQNLDPEDHRVDGVLKHFLKSHFGEPAAPKYPKPKKKKASPPPVLDISFSDCAVPNFPQSGGIPFRPVPAGGTPSGSSGAPGGDVAAAAAAADVGGVCPPVDPSAVAAMTAAAAVGMNANNLGLIPGAEFKRRFNKPMRIKRFTKRTQRKSKKQQFQSAVQATLSRTVVTKGEAYAYSQSDMKPASCHQCKSNKLPIHLLFCSSGKKKKGQRSCHKKFCDLCLQRYASSAEVINKMSEQRRFKAGSVDTYIWICPACENRCTCAGCKRKRAAQAIKATKAATSMGIDVPGGAGAGSGAAGGGAESAPGASAAKNEAKLGIQLPSSGSAGSGQAGAMHNIDIGGLVDPSVSQMAGYGMGGLGLNGPGGPMGGFDPAMIAMMSDPRMLAAAGLNYADPSNPLAAYGNPTALYGMAPPGMGGMTMGGSQQQMMAAAQMAAMMGGGPQPPPVGTDGAMMYGGGGGGNGGGGMVGLPPVVPSDASATSGAMLDFAGQPMTSAAFDPTTGMPLPPMSPEEQQQYMDAMQQQHHEQQQGMAAAADANVSGEPPMAAAADASNGSSFVALPPPMPPTDDAVGEDAAAAAAADATPPAADDANDTVEAAPSAPLAEAPTVDGVPVNVAKDALAPPPPPMAGMEEVTAPVPSESESAVSNATSSAMTDDAPANDAGKENHTPASELTNGTANHDSPSDANLSSATATDAAADSAMTGATIGAKRPIADDEGGNADAGESEMPPAKRAKLAESAPTEELGNGVAPTEITANGH